MELATSSLNRSRTAESVSANPVIDVNRRAEPAQVRTPTTSGANTSN